MRIMTRAMQYQRFDFKMWTAISSPTTEKAPGANHIVELHLSATWFKFQTVTFTVDESRRQITAWQATVSGGQDYWGVEKTAARIAAFVINATGGDREKMQAARAGVIEGFRQAAIAFKGALPEISGQTINRALELIDQAMEQKGQAE